MSSINAVRRVLESMGLLEGAPPPVLEHLGHALAAWTIYEPDEDLDLYFALKWRRTADGELERCGSLYGADLEGLRRFIQRADTATCLGRHPHDAEEVLETWV